MAKIYYNDNGTWKVVNVSGGGGGGASEYETGAGVTFNASSDKYKLYGDSTSAMFVEISNSSGPTGYYRLMDSTGVLYSQNQPVSTSNFKTLFGNQSIVGSGNIDLYKHVIKFSGSTSEINTECYCVVYSSKNLNVDSLTDLKTLLGNTFVEVCTGNVRYKTQQDNAAQAVLVKESGIYYCLGGSSYYLLETAGWTGITISDTVTTV